MIFNDKQFELSNETLIHLNNSLAEIRNSLVEDPALREISIKALISQISDIKREMQEYTQLKNGQKLVKILSNQRDLPLALVQTRIASGKSQFDVANKIELDTDKFQQLEESIYKDADYGLLIGIAEILEISIPKGFKEESQQSHQSNSLWSSFNRSSTHLWHPCFRPPKSMCEREFAWKFETSKSVSPELTTKKPLNKPVFESKSKNFRQNPLLASQLLEQIFGGENSLPKYIKNLNTKRILQPQNKNEFKSQSFRIPVITPQNNEKIDMAA